MLRYAVFACIPTAMRIQDGRNDGGREGAKHKGRPRSFDRGEALRIALEMFWKRGFEPTTVADLCAAIDIKPPSLYATFGNKADLFLEAVRYYEDAYWQDISARFAAEPDLRRAVGDFFSGAARILLSPDTPCGCMVVLAAVNICEEEKEIISAIRAMRADTRGMFANKLRQAIKDGQIPADTDVPSLAGALNALLEGLSLQARDDICQAELVAMAAFAVRMLPPKLK